MNTDEYQELLYSIDEKDKRIKELEESVVARNKMMGMLIEALEDEYGIKARLH